MNFLSPFMLISVGLLALNWLLLYEIKSKVRWIKIDYDEITAISQKLDELVGDLEDRRGY